MGLPRGDGPREGELVVDLDIERLDQLVDALSPNFTSPTGILIWLFTPSIVLFHETPAQWILDGKLEQVMHRCNLNPPHGGTQVM